MKKLLVMMLVTTMAVMMLAGCGNETENVNNINTSEVENSQAESEMVSEEVSEETTEEISEEVAEEETYSAQEVMDLIDELTAKYQYNDPEHIKALVIAANLDYITAEDLDTILSTYGYTIDELSALYDECAMDSHFAIANTIKYYNGTLDSILPEQEYDNRIALADVMLNENDKQFATSLDETLRLIAHLDGESRAVLGEIRDTEYSTSGEHTVVNFAYTLGEGVVMENPYAAYQNTME